MLPNQKPRKVDRTAASFIAGPRGASEPVSLRNNQCTSSVIMAANGPKRKKEIIMGSSAKSIWRYGISGNGTDALASVRIAASAAKTAAPARVMVKFFGFVIKGFHFWLVTYQEKRFYLFSG